MLDALELETTDDATELLTVLELVSLLIEFPTLETSDALDNEDALEVGALDKDDVVELTDEVLDEDLGLSLPPPPPQAPKINANEQDNPT